MGNVKLRCHFSIIFESLWQFWTALAVILLNQIDDVVSLVREATKNGFAAAMKDGGFWVLGGLLLVSLAVFLWQFLRWRKTWVVLEDNLVILEKDTLKKTRNTIAIENISAVNVEKNLFERMAGTRRLKLDTNSASTADKTDVSIVFRDDVAEAFRKELMARINAAKAGRTGAKAAGENFAGKDQMRAEAGGAFGGKAFCASKKDVLSFAFYSISLWSLLAIVAAAAFSGWFISSFGFDRFLEQVVGSFIAVAIMAIGAIFDIVGKFLSYYGFTVYRDGRDLHVRKGLIKLRSYTIPVDKITAMTIEQKPFARLCKKYCASVVTVGVGDESGETSNITVALGKKELEYWLSELLPEYCWADTGKVKPEEKGAVAVRLAKSVKWHILTLTAVLVMILLTDLSLWIAVFVPVTADAYINLLYFLSHKSAGYMAGPQGLLLAEGYFSRKFTACAYRRVQMLTMNYHPLTRKRGVGNGRVHLLNKVADVPFIRRGVAMEISEKIIGGK